MLVQFVLFVSVFIFDIRLYDSFQHIEKSKILNNFEENSEIEADIITKEKETFENISL